MNKLFKQYLKGICQQEDLKLLLYYFGKEEYKITLENLIEEEFLKQDEQPFPAFLSSMLTRNRSILLEKINRSKRQQNSNWPLWTSVAASISTILTTTGSPIRTEKTIWNIIIQSHILDLNLFTAWQDQQDLISVLLVYVI